MTIGILALQGDVREHEAAFFDLGVSTRPVRLPGDLADVAGVVLPGGESTTLSMLLESSGLFDPLAQALADGLPVFGTCAGLILLAREVLDGRPDQRTFGLLDCSVRRNGYGRQVSSFETRLDPGGVPGAVAGAGNELLPAIFIRAPRVCAVGPEVEVLVRLEEGGDPVVCRQGPVLATAFHPELGADRRIHGLFARMTGDLLDAG